MNVDSNQKKKETATKLNVKKIRENKERKAHTSIFSIIDSNTKVLKRTRIKGQGQRGSQSQNGKSYKQMSSFNVGIIDYLPLLTLKMCFSYW